MSPNNKINDAHFSHFSFKSFKSLPHIKLGDQEELHFVWDLSFQAIRLGPLGYRGKLFLKDVKFYSEQKILP